jgi:hypothetical protein
MIVLNLHFMNVKIGNNENQSRIMDNDKIFFNYRYASINFYESRWNFGSNDEICMIGLWNHIQNAFIYSFPCIMKFTWNWNRTIWKTILSWAGNNVEVVNHSLKNQVLLFLIQIRDVFMIMEQLITMMEMNRVHIFVQIQKNDHQIDILME